MMRTQFSCKYLILLFTAGFFLPQGSSLCAQSHKIMINELVAKNERGFPDEEGNRSDWVELFNSGEEPCDFGGMFLTDDEKEPQKWQIQDHGPETNLPAKGRCVLFLDGCPEAGVLHGPFKLSRKGESLFLYDRDGKSLVDQVSFPELPADISWARISDGNSIWSYAHPATANRANPSVGSTEILKKPKFDLKSGWFNGVVTLTISCEPGAQVYFTRDGSQPIASEDFLYTKPIEITETTVVRARAFQKKCIPSEIATRNFFIDEVQSSLPVLAVTVDPKYLWGKEEGIFHRDNKWHDTENPAHVAYYQADQEKLFSLNGGIKVQGSFSRNFAKKSFTITAGQRFGKKKIKGKLFTDIDRNRFDGLVVRADCNYAGYDDEELNWAGDRIRNELMYQVNKEMRSSVIMQAYQPAEVYLNGKYWGLYNVMERKNKDFIEDHYPGVGEIDMINPAVAWDEGYTFETYQGDGDAYRAMEAYIKASDMSNEAVYDRLCQWIDIDNLIDSWIYEIYTVKGDPTSNSRLWRPRTEDGKWQSIAFDWDHWGEQDWDWIHKFANKRRGKSWLFANLIKNREFQIAFINRLCDYLNTTLSTKNVHRLIWEIHERVEIEKRRDRARWSQELEFMPWGDQIEEALEFSEERPDYLYDEMSDFFELPGTAEVELTVNDPAAGTLRISTLEISRFPWTGKYMQGVPVKVEAKAMAGYRFVGWEDPETMGDQPIAIITLSGSNQIKAFFEPQS